MYARSKCILVGMVCAMVSLLATVAFGTDKSWVSTMNGEWKEDFNWDPQEEPDGDDKTFHTSTAVDNRIAVTENDDLCHTFTGDGTEDSTRYLLIEAAKALVVGADGTTGNGLTAATSNNFTVKVASGTAANARTKLSVAGHVKDIDLFHASGDSGDYVDIEIGDDESPVELKDSSVDFSSGDNGEFTLYGDVIDSHIQVGDNWDVFDISGDVDGGSSPERLFVGNDCTVAIDGNVEGAIVQAGTSAGGSSTKTTMAIGSVGGVDGMGSTETWTIRGYSEVTVAGDFRANSETAPTITQRESSKITTGGETLKARWDLFDNSLYTGTEVITQGTWNLANDSRVIAQDGISAGSGTTWTVNSDGTGGSTFGLHAQTNASSDSIIASSLGATFNVGTSTLVGTVMADGDIEGGTWNVKKSGSFVESDLDIKGESAWVVDAASISARKIGWNGSGHPVWALTLKNGASLTAVEDTWHEPSTSGDNGLLTYSGTGNTYTLIGEDNQSEIGLEGPIKNVAGTSTLDILLPGASDYQRIQMPADVTALDPYDTEGITVQMIEHDCDGVSVNTFEAVGPDYDGYWHSSNRVIFKNSPCVAAWGNIQVLNLNSTVNCRSVADHHQNTPISGDSAEEGTDFPDALYVVNMEIAKNTKFRNLDAVGGGDGSDAVNIYYEDCDVLCDSTISGCGASYKCNNPSIPTGCDCGVLDMQGGKDDYEAVVTVYGDFDGDKGSVTDEDDLDFFNEFFPSCLDEGSGNCACGGGGEPACNEYNPLVDYNCDGFVDCTDRDKFVCYRQGSETHVHNDLSCSTPTCLGQ